MANWFCPNFHWWCIVPSTEIHCDQSRLCVRACMFHVHVFRPMLHANFLLHRYSTASCVMSVCAHACLLLVEMICSWWAALVRARIHTNTQRMLSESATNHQMKTLIKIYSIQWSVRLESIPPLACSPQASVLKNELLAHTSTLFLSPSLYLRVCVCVMLPAYYTVYRMQS